MKLPLKYRHSVYPFRYTWVLIFFFICFTFKSQAQDTSKTTPTKKVKNFRLTGLVLPSRTPENGWYGQGGIIGLFKTNPKDSSLRASNIYLFGLYSQYMQYRISNGGDIFTNNEKYYINYWMYYSYLPDFYYGNAAQSRPEVSELINYRVLYFNAIAARKFIFKNHFIGLRFHAESVYDINYAPGGLYAQTHLTTANRFTRVGLGLQYRIDRRNSLFATSKGYMLTAEINTYPSFLGTTYNATQWTLDFRTFKQYGKKFPITLCLQYYMQWAFGDIPFRFLPSHQVRAFHSNLLRDKFVQTVQGEFRWNLLKRWAWSGFAGLGQVGINPGAWNDYNLKWNAGTGIRFNILRAYNMNVRLEYAWGSSGSNNLYVSFYDEF